MVQIGKITSTHGIKGEVKIYSYSDFNRFLIGESIYAQKDDAIHKLTIKSSRKHKQMFIVLFEEYSSINDVLFLKDFMLYSETIKKNLLDKDDYHYQQLIGKKVYTNQNEFVGIVVHMIEVPQGHLMEIQREGMKNALIPFVKAFIGDITKEMIIVHPIEGLL